MNMSKILNLTLIPMIIILIALMFQNSNFLILGITAILALVWFKSMNQMKKENEKTAELVKMSKSYARDKNKLCTSASELNNISSVIDENINKEEGEDIEEEILKAGIQSGIVARSFASIEDAVKLGWQFKEQIGSIGNQKIYKLALNNGRVWEFDGLSHDPLSPVIPENIRLFGRLQYQEKTQ